jgi:hypothetical protein
MLSSSNVLDFLFGLLSGWSHCTKDVNGLSVGLETNWNSTFEVIDSSSSNYGIWLKGVVKEIGLEVHILNYNRPYEDCKEFWESREM